MIRPASAPQLAFDVALAVVCVALRLLVGGGSPAMMLAVLLLGGALAAHRLSPAVALAIAWVGALLQVYAGEGPDVANLAILVVLYSTARRGEPVVKWTGLASAVAGALIASVYLIFVDPWNFSTGPAFDTGAIIPRLGATFLASFAVLGLSWTVGLLVRTWRGAADARVQKAEAERSVVVEQERNRIARDMHDVVAHSLSVVIAQADGARYARERDPGAVDDALSTIASTARDALGDVRVLLAQLRHSQHEGPQPGLDDLDRLLGQLRSAGLGIDFEETGTPLLLPAGAQLAVYRIVQEALTNALRHGDPDAPAGVRFHWSDSALEATISNAATSAPLGEPPLAHGIPGMRERAALVGGSLTVQHEDGEFVVRASIPVLNAAVAR